MIPSNSNKDIYIQNVKVKTFRVPTETPEADGTLKWQKTEMVYVEIDADDITGIGYSYADVSTATFINAHLTDVVMGMNPLDIPYLWNRMYHKIRNLGNPGISSMAISAIDVALWDLKSKLLHLPLVRLLGKMHDNIPVYGSGGFTSYSADQLEKQFHDWMDEGITMFKMKIGEVFQDDLKRMEQAKKIIGNDNQLFVDANGAYTTREAVMAANAMHQWNVTWFEEPVSSDDLEGLNFVRHHCPPEMNVTAGEYGYDVRYFNRMLQFQAVDVMQMDVTRCGGVSGFLKAAALCDANNIVYSAHTAPSVHAHVCCALKGAVHVEYFYDHTRIENMFFEGFLKAENGKLTPDLSKPGLGIKLKEADAKKYLVS